MSDADKSYDRLHGVDGHTQAVAPTLADFLLARIAEDEAVAVLATKPGRVLADCEAKRQRVEILVEMDGAEENLVSSYAHSLMCREAFPYADHPDYREEWKP